MISKVKVYPILTSRKKKFYIYFISLVSIQKGILVQTVQIKNIMLELKTATAFHARWSSRPLPPKPFYDTIMHRASVSSSRISTTDSKDERHQQVQYKEFFPFPNLYCPIKRWDSWYTKDCQQHKTQVPGAQGPTMAVTKQWIISSKPAAIGKVQVGKQESG